MPSLKDAVAAKTFESFASLNTFTSISHIKEVESQYILSVSSSQRDYPSNQKINNIEHILYDSKAEKTVSLNPVAPDPSIAAVSFSPSGSLQVSLKTVAEKRFLIFPGSSSVEVTKVHGSFYTDEYFGSNIAWNGRESWIAYIAEALEPSGDEKFNYEADAGEGYTGKRPPVLVLVDIKKKSTIVIQHDSLFGYAQPVFMGDRIYFVGLIKESLRLGVKFCTNRNTSLFSSTLNGSDLQRHGAEKRSVRYPQLTPDGSSLIYLSNPTGGPHDSCASLIKYSAVNGKEDVVIGEIDTPQSINDFPGLFSQTLSSHCFVKGDDVLMILSSIWRSRNVVLAINLTTKKVENLCLDGTSSWIFQKCTLDGQIFAISSCFNELPSIMTRNVIQSTTWTIVSRSKVNDQELIDQISCIEYQISLIPHRSDTLEVIYLSSSSQVHSFSSQTKPLIIMPHGGPHGCITTSWNFSIASFLTLGFKVCCVNYTGSTGFGNSSIKRLIGNIGILDIDDVHAAAQWASQQIGVSAQNVFIHGGSHGGFIGGHLLTREWHFYRGGCLRNPVMNVGSMPYTSDIPDWCFSEAGIEFDCSLPLMPSPSQYNEMYQASPVYHSDFPSSKTCPVLLHLGEGDRRVPHSQGLRWAEVLKGKGMDVKVMMFPATGHALDSMDAERVGFEAAVAFFIKHMKF